MKSWIGRSAIIIVALLIGVAFFLHQYHDTETDSPLLLTSILVILGVAGMILANRLVTIALDRALPWVRYQSYRFVVQLVLGLVVSLLIVNGLYFLLKQLYTETAPDLGQIILVNVYSALLILPCISVYFGIKFVRAWNQSQLETEQLLKENARSQMMSLRNHLDPHFLFNNLNILSSLMDHDLELSKRYLDRFAEVYRTILRSELSDLTTLEEELRLMKAYIYLIKIRWKNGLDIHIDIDDSHLSKALPPLSGQMLLENAIKHNTITSQAPMTISITADDKALIVENSKNLKQFDQSSHSGTGLQNITNRYAYFTDRSPQIQNLDDRFVVQLPLLTIHEN
ncbi:MAG: histidine kinase [Bacteroidota bacterium]